MTETFIPAPHGLRAAAWLIDLAVVIIVFAFLPQPFYYLLFLALFVAYHAVQVWLRHKTIGKALLGLEVRRIGRNPGPWWSIGRASVGYLVIDIMGLGVLPAFFTRQHRCLHDVAFGSVVALEGIEKITLRTMASRLIAFAEAHLEAVKAKKKPITILLAFWGFLLWLGKTLKTIIDFLAGLKAGAAPAASPSIIAVLSTKAVVAIAATATVANAALYEYVPVVHTAVEWLIAPRYIGATARLSGEVRNAVDDALVEGADVKLLDGPNADPADAPRFSTSTDDKGAFVFDGVPVGEYTIVTSHDGFTDGIVTGVTLQPEGTLTQLVALSPGQRQGQMRIVLTWGSAPEDLDSHLVGFNGGAEAFHVDFNSKGGDASEPYAVLDLDHTDGQGPETITIHRLVAASYCYAVHDYSNDGSQNSAALRNSQARVDVYEGNTLRTSFTVPAADGTLWTVFRMTDGQIMPINTVSYASAPGPCG
jgi:hypothetical protein